MELEKYRNLAHKIMIIAKECNTHGWDGMAAKSVSGVTALESLRFLKALPDGIILPQVVPETSGEIGFAWVKRQGVVFCVNVLGRKLRYACLLNGQSMEGHFFFIHELPARMTQILSDHFW